MKYLTKEWYNSPKKYSNFPMTLEIIYRGKRSLEEIFQTEYKNTFNKMKDSLPEEYMFRKIFESYVENVKRFFSKYTLSKIADIRLLALGKVFKEEYALVEEEIIKKDAIQAYNKSFKEIEDRVPANIKENLNLHDCLITNIIKEENKLIIELDCSGGFIKIKNIVFDNYTIIKEQFDFINSWCLYEEIYIVENQYELHLLIDVPNKKDSKLGYFTIRAKDIIFE